MEGPLVQLFHQVACEITPALGPGPGLGTFAEIFDLKIIQRDVELEIHTSQVSPVSFQTKTVVAVYTGTACQVVDLQGEIIAYGNGKLGILKIGAADL